MLNPAAFTTPAPGTFGNVPRNALRGPDFRQFDLIINKRFKFSETTNLEFGQRSSMCSIGLTLIFRDRG